MKNTSLRIVSLLLFCLLAASAVAESREKPADVFADAPVMLTKAELDTVQFVPNQPGPDGKVSPLRLAVRLNKKAYAVGEPVWAYFIVKNTGSEEVNTDMRIDVASVVPTTCNNCGIELEPVDASFAKQLQGAGIWDGPGPWVRLQPGDYYVVRIDLQRFSKLGHLAAGAYDISWHSRPATSNRMRFTVSTDLPAPPLELRRLESLAYAKLGVASRIRLERRSNCNDVLLTTDEFITETTPTIATALALGVHDRYYPDPYHLPRDDGRLAVELELYDADRKSVEAGRTPHRLAVTFTTKREEGVEIAMPHFYIAVAKRPLERLQSLQQMLEQLQLQRLVTVTPEKPVTFHLPYPQKVYFGTKPDEECRLHVLVTSFDLSSHPNLWHRGLRQLGTLAQERSDWQGVLATNSVDVAAPESWSEARPIELQEQKLMEFEEVLIDDD